MDFYSKLLQKNAYGYDISGLVKDDGPENSGPDGDASRNSGTNGAKGDQKNYPGAEMHNNEQEALVTFDTKNPPTKIKSRSM